jgi:hypothetical protein
MAGIAHHHNVERDAAAMPGKQRQVGAGKLASGRARAPAVVICAAVSVESSGAAYSSTSAPAARSPSIRTRLRG